MNVRRLCGVIANSVIFLLLFSFSTQDYLPYKTLFPSPHSYLLNSVYLLSILSLLVSYPKLLPHSFIPSSVPSLCLFQCTGLADAVVFIHRLHLSYLCRVVSVVSCLRELNTWTRLLWTRTYFNTMLVISCTHSESTLVTTIFVSQLNFHMDINGDRITNETVFMTNY